MLKTEILLITENQDIKSHKSKCLQFIYVRLLMILQKKSAIHQYNGFKYFKEIS